MDSGKIGRSSVSEDVGFWEATALKNSACMPPLERNRLDCAPGRLGGMEFEPIGKLSEFGKLARLNRSSTIRSLRNKVEKSRLDVTFSALLCSSCCFATDSSCWRMDHKCATRPSSDFGERRSTLHFVMSQPSCTCQEKGSFGSSW